MSSTATLSPEELQNIAAAAKNQAGEGVSTGPPQPSGIQLPAGQIGGNYQYNPQGSSGSPPLTADQTAQQQANAQAATEVAGQVGPLQGQISQLQQNQTQQIGAVNSEFNNLLPYAAGQADQTAQFNQGAAQDSAAIYAQAQTALNGLQQNQASEAQRLAQQIGGPVSTGAFTAATDPYETAMHQSGATSQLTNLALGVANTDEARAFAGQVLPAMKTEQEAAIRSTINGKIADLKTQIATIQGTKSKLADAKLPALLAAQRGYELQKQQLALKKQAQNESWQATVRALDQKDRQLADAEQAERFGEGLSNKKITLTQEQIDNEVAHLSVEEKQAAQKLGLSYNEYVLRANQYAASNALAQKRIDVQEQSNTRSLIDGFLGGASSNRPVTVTVKTPLGLDSPQVKAALSATSGLGAIKGEKPPSNVYLDPKTHQWYTYTKKTETPQQFAQENGTAGTPVSDPNALYNALKAAQGSSFNPKLAINLIRFRMGLPNWSPGKNGLGNDTTGNPANPEAIPTAKVLAGMSISKLTDIAEAHGFKPSPVAASRQSLIDFIRHATGT